MPPSQRDAGLDFLKGVACLLMVLSHAEVPSTHPLVLGFGFLGSFAAVLFFSVSSVTASFQGSKYAPGGVLLTYLLLFLCGFSLNGMLQINFYQRFEMEMLQMIAVGAAVVYLLQHYRHPGKTFYLIAAAGVFVIKVLLDLAAGQSPGLSSALAPLRGSLLAPGTFTVIPWLSIFFLGMFCYQASPLQNLALSSGFACLVVFAGVLALRTPYETFDKWDMTLGYFALSGFFVSLGYYTVRRFDRILESRFSVLLNYLGANSLLFLFIHILVINVLYQFNFPRLAWLYWPVVLGLSILMIYGIQRGFPSGLGVLFGHPFSWLLLALLILSIPLLTTNRVIVFGLECVLGVLLSTQYPHLRQVFKRQEVRA